MTEPDLRALITGGESFDIEFKGESRHPLNDADLVEAVVCLANRPGDRSGYLLVGVEDNGRVTGARPRHEAGITDLFRVQALISGRTRPALSVVTFLAEVEGKPILVVQIPPARQPVGTTDGKYLRRSLGGDGKPACVPFHFHEMQSLQASRGLLDYSAVAVPGVTWENLDPLEFERFRRSIRETGKGDAALLELPDLELAKALGTVFHQADQLTVRVAGVLLFGREDTITQYLPTHEVAFQELRGVNVTLNHFVRWPLVRIMDEFASLSRARYEEDELTVDMVRVGVPNYPAGAMRELVANALIHRDYTRLGAVHVQWHSAHVEMGNPGGFPEGVRLDNLLVTQPQPRNPLLADIFKRAGLVERTARGIDLVYHEFLRCGRRPPSYARSTEASVVVVTNSGEPDLAFVRLVAEETGNGRDLTLDELLILRSMADDGQVGLPQAARLIQKPGEEAHATLHTLAQAGLVVESGGRKERVYRLSPPTNRRLGRSVAYARQSGIEALQQERTALQFVEKHGSITRREVADLCELSPDQAYRLLVRLTERGALRSEQSGKATRYARVKK